MAKKLWNLLLAGVIVSTLFFGGGIDAYAVYSLDNSKTQPEADSVGQRADTVLNGFEKIAESENLELYLEKETLSIQVKEKKTGAVYSSFMEESEGINEIWKNFIRSGVTVEYMNNENKLTKISSGTSQVKFDIRKQKDGFAAAIDFGKGISLELRVTLCADRITVEIPRDSIQEKEKDNKLENVYLYPFLGASSGNDVPGYLFIPDGCGALIRTDRPTAATSGLYSKRVYGQELAIGDFTTLTERAAIINAEQIYAPVYGIIQHTGKRGIAAIIEEGDEYSSIEASVSAKETPVNYVTSKFMFREPYTRYLDKKGKTMVANQSRRNETGIKEHFYFLTGEKADYVGIADTYRNYLEEKEALSSEENKAEGDIPLKLEILLAEEKDMLIGKTSQVMTTWKDTDRILSELKKDGISNISPVLRGFSKQGASAAAPLKADFLSKTGSREDWRKLAEKYHRQGIEFGFYADLSKGYKGNRGFSQKKDVVQSISENLLTTWDNGMFSYLSPSYAKQAYKKETEKLKKAGASFVALDTAGYQLSSNWNKNAPSSRSEARELIQQIQNEGIKNAYYRPNSYLWNQAKAIYDIPMSSSQYLVFTDTVPFLQMVLKGSVPYYASASNFHADAHQSLLSMIEYGAYPSFFITQEDSVELLETASDWLYTTKYATWKKKILEEYKLLNGVLKQVEGAYITNRTVPAEGIVFVAYSNGITVAVNYTDELWQADGISIEAEGFCVIGN